MLQENRYKAMLLAAGMGSRLKQLTQTRPKALVEVGDESLLAQNLKRLAHSGVAEVVVNVHHFADQVISFLNEFHHPGLCIRISDERDQLLDTGGGVWKAEALLAGKTPFLVHNVDVLSDLDFGALLQVHLNSGALASLVVLERPSSRQFLFDDGLLLCGWENQSNGERRLSRKPEGKLRPLAFCGIQVMEGDIFKSYPRQGAFSLVEAYLDMAAANPIQAFIPPSMRWMDVGKVEDIDRAREFARGLRG